jgi:hypothetical protein
MDLQYLPSNLLAIPLQAFWLPFSSVVFSSSSRYAASDLLLVHCCQRTNRNFTNLKGGVQNLELIFVRLVVSSNGAFT